MQRWKTITSGFLEFFLTEKNYIVIIIINAIIKILITWDDRVKYVKIKILTFDYFLYLFKLNLPNEAVRKAKKFLE